jgi:hypothetical protein
MRAGARGGTVIAVRHVRGRASGITAPPEKRSAARLRGRLLLNGEIVARALSDLAESRRREQLERIAGQ